VFFAVYKPIDGDGSQQPWLVVVTLSVITAFLLFVKAFEQQYVTFI
jgi:hypothetical protein